MTTVKKSNRVTTEYKYKLLGITQAIVMPKMLKNYVFVRTVQMWCFEECMEFSFKQLNVRPVSKKLVATLRERYNAHKFING